MKVTKHKRLSSIGRAGVLLVLVIILGAPLPGVSLIIYDENINGDLTNLDMPIQFILGIGSNEIVGTVQYPVDIFDPFSFVVVSGQQLSQLILVELERTVAITLFSGPIPLVPNDIGGIVAQLADVGTDLLPLMGLSPLLPGTYSARIFTAYQPERPYHLDLLQTAPVPELSTMLLLGSGFIGLVGYGRKKFFKK